VVGVSAGAESQQDEGDVIEGALAGSQQVGVG
jgi:hypothetical protein